MSDARLDPPKLRGAQKRHLRKLAHDLDPVVQVGASGVSESVVAAVDGALAAHELIKLRIAHERPERQEMAEALAAETGSVLAGMVGRVAVLYRPAADPEDRRISLPA
ncbi:MAG: ribosome assembly RNA-binding protein YhbY [Myxococcota bacterium]